MEVDTSVERAEELYQIIGGKLTGIIPDKWDKIYLYAEILPDSRIIYFYFNSLTKNELIYSHLIPSVYGVDRDVYIQLLRELQQSFAELNSEFSENSPQTWTNLTMYVDRSGKFNIDYSYDEILISPTHQRTIWEYEVLGMYPTDNFHRKILDEYLKNKSE